MSMNDNIAFLKGIKWFKGKKKKWRNGEIKKKLSCDSFKNLGCG